MPRYAVNKETGQKLLYDESAGSWREPTSAEVRIERMGFAGQAASAVEGATGLGALAGLVSPQAAESSQAMQSINPISGNVGLGLGLATAVAPAVRGAMGLAGKAGGLTQRVQSKIAAREGMMGFRRMPDEMLPPSMGGAGKLLRAGTTATVPGRLATDMLIRVPNQRNLDRLIGRSLRLTDDELRANGGKITDDLYGVIQERSNEAYREVAGRISQAVDPNEVTQLALKMNQEGLITNQKLLAMTDKSADMGENIMALRSEARAAQRQTQDFQIKNMLQDTVDEIDKVIKDSLEKANDEVAMALYKDANARYKMELALETGNVLGRDGHVSATLLDTQLRKLFKDQYRSGKRIEGIPSELADALQGARIAQGLNIGLPTSGTAERLLGASMVYGLTGGALGGSL